MPMTFPRKALMAWNGQQVTDHNRSELSVETERIGTDKRMANGTMRRYIVADKHSFNVSWSDLPVPYKTSEIAADKSYTVDGNIGAREIEDYFKKGLPFALQIYPNGGAETPEEYLVVITDFSKDLTKRGAKFDLWDVDITMEEV